MAEQSGSVNRESGADGGSGSVDTLARTVLTFTLSAILAGSVIAAWIFYAHANNSTKFHNLETMIGVLITPVFSLFAAAVGFYYGERRGRRP